MKASALAVVAAIGVGITSGATAEVEFETSSILYYGGPYFVAEQGDYHLEAGVAIGAGRIGLVVPGTISPLRPTE